MFLNLHPNFISSWFIRSKLEYDLDISEPTTVLGDVSLTPEQKNSLTRENLCLSQERMAKAHEWLEEVSIYTDGKKKT